MNLITSLARSNNRANKTRSILIIICIFMTTLLLTVIASVGYGMVKYQQESAVQLYGSYHGRFGGVSEETLGEMRTRSEFGKVGVCAEAGIVDSDRNLTLEFVDGTARELTNVQDKLAAGEFPQRGQEIAGYASFFEALGVVNPQVGDAVTLRSRANLQSPFEEETFVISGILRISGQESGNEGAGYVSEEYYHQHFPQEERSCIAYFQLHESIYINYENAEEVLNELAQTLGIKERNVSANKLYIMWEEDPGTDILVTCGGICLLVVLFAVRVIYNIFQVGIVQKVQEYGKIKALGATRRQMKRLVRKEGMMLAWIGVPLGIAAGVIAAYFFFGWMMGLGRGTAGEHMKISPVVLLVVAAVSVLTVWLAIKKPMRVVAGIAPVEAMRYQEQAGRRGGLRKGKKELSVTSLTFANLGSHRKRNIATILTMGLSGVLFLVLANFAGNMDDEHEARREVEHGDFQVELDYSMNDTVYKENNLDSILRNNPLNPDVLEKIAAMDGVEHVETRDILILETADGKETVCVLNREDFENIYGDSVPVGTFSYDSISQGKEIVYGWRFFLDELNCPVGGQMQGELTDGTRTAAYESRMAGTVDHLDTGFCITEDTAEAMGFSAGSSVYKVWVTCQEGCWEQVAQQLIEFFEGTEHVEMKSYAGILETWRRGFRMMRGGCYGLAALIGAISFLNMANTLIASSITRKREFGILQAMGMTNRQLNMSLQLEGMLFTIGTVAVAMAVGTPLGYLVFRWCRDNGLSGLYAYHFPALELAAMIAFLVLFQLALSFVLTRNVKKESLVERIRYQG